MSTLALWKLHWRHPVVAPVAIAAFLVGAVGGMVPTGFLVLSEGAGVGRGAAWGLWAFAAMSPFLVVYAVSALCAARYQWHVDRDLFLAGQSQAVTTIRDGLGALSVAVLLVVPAAVGGVIVGIADAVARGTGVLTPFSVQALIAAGAAASWWSVLAIAVVGIVRSAMVSLFIIGAFFFAGLAAIGLIDAQIAWDALSASPYGPFTLVVRDVVTGRNGLETSTPLVAIGCVVWPALIGWFALRRQRRLLPRAPGTTAGA